MKIWKICIWTNFNIFWNNFRIRSFLYNRCRKKKNQSLQVNN